MDHVVSVPDDLEDELQREVERLNATKTGEKTPDVDASGLLWIWAEPHLRQLRQETQDRVWQERRRMFEDAPPEKQAEADVAIGLTVAASAVKR